MKDKFLKVYNFIIVKHKKKSIISGLIMILIVLIFGIGYFYYGIGMSDKTKANTINSAISKKDYNKARDLTDRYVKGNDEQSIALKKLHISIIDTCEQSNTGSLEEATKKYKELKDYVNTVKIVKVDITKEKYNSSYHNVEVTVQNNGKENINYVKIGLDFKDKNGNIVQSDWTNDSSVIKPNAKQTIKKMISNDIKYDTVQAEVQDFK